MRASGREARHGLGCVAKAAERLGIVAGAGGRRRWSEADKAAIVAESLQAGGRVGAVARRHGLMPQQLTAWRRAVLHGRLGPTSGGSTLGLVPLVVEAVAPASVAAIELEVGGVILRLAADVPAARLASIVAALWAVS